MPHGEGAARFKRWFAYEHGPFGPYTLLTRDLLQVQEKRYQLG